MNSKPNVVLLLGVLGLVALVIVVAMLAKSGAGQDVSQLLDRYAAPVATEVGAEGVPRVSATDHARGAQNPKVVWIEYGDFDCPYCQIYHVAIKQLLAAYPNDVQVVFRHFPLDIHPNARMKANASECVAAMGGEEAFWRFHDLLYENPEEQVAVLASRAGVDGNAVMACATLGEHDMRVAGDMATGDAAGIEGTPVTFIVSQDGTGTLVPGAIPFETMQDIMDYLLANYEGTQ